MKEKNTKVVKYDNDLFLRACWQLPVERTPIWVMRQAGRYLPQYRKVREKADFITMCKTPEIAAEVTIQPVDLIGVDAAIIFSDILVIPEAMGMPFEMNEGKGPIFLTPFRHTDQLNDLKKVKPEEDLKYVMDAIKLVKKELNNKVPLIGFCGSPFTLMTYMVEGRGSKNFAEIKSFIFNQPKVAHKLLSKLAAACSDYLAAKIDAGADAVQIFDTWGGILSPADYAEFSLPYINKIIAKVKSKHNVPVIVFSKGVHYLLEQVSNSGADVIGLDWTMNLGEVRKRIKNRTALQGNLDPTVLFGSEKLIKQKAEEVMQSYGVGNGHIFNLGHGILPNMDPDKLKFLVDYVKSESYKYHSKRK